MQRLAFAAPHAGGYAEALPDGFYAYDGPAGIVTPHGMLPTPSNQRALYLCLSNVPQLAICGGSDDTGYIADVAFTGWASCGPVYGARPLLFDAADQLVAVHGAADYGAGQGFRFVDYATGQLWLGDDTKYDASIGLCEWIRRGELTAGQAVTDELCIHNAADNTLRIVERGVWRHIKFRRSGDALALAGVRFDTQETVLLWLTVAELAGLPLYEAGTTPIDPPVEPIDPEVPVLIPNRFSVVQAINSQYPHLLQQNTESSCGEFTERVVWELSRSDDEWGHVGKVGGQTQWNGHAVDAIMYRVEPSTAIDIISGAHNPPHAGSPAWMEVESGGQPWLAPIPVDGSTPPPSGGGSNDTTALEARITALEANAVQVGQRIGLRMDGGQVLCANNGGGSESHQPVTFESRDGIGPHETFTIERGQG